MKAKILFGVFLAHFLIFSSFSQSQSLELVKQGMDYIYNRDFQKSKAIIARIENQMQKSAIPDLMKAIEIFWQFYPVHLNEAQIERYQDHLLKSYSRSMEVLENDPENPEAIFLAMASQGLLAESYADTGRSFKAVGAAKKAYNYVKTGTEKMNKYKEFYVSTGLYNYYREYYPEAHPIYKPFMYFFMKGDKQLGIKQLEFAANEASFSHVIAQYYLSYIYMRYEYITNKALRQGRRLHKTYPNNDLFAAIYLESLIINSKYQEAVPVARKLKNHSNPYLKIYGQLFMGVIEEQSNQNYARAESLYRDALKMNQDYNMQRDHLEAYAYLGLGRIYEQKNDPMAKKYFKESLDKAYTKALRDEAKSHLN